MNNRYQRGRSSDDLMPFEDNIIDNSHEITNFIVEPYVENIVGHEQIEQGLRQWNTLLQEGLPFESHTIEIFLTGVFTQTIFSGFSLVKYEMRISYQAKPVNNLFVLSFCGRKRKEIRIN